MRGAQQRLGPEVAREPEGRIVDRAGRGSEIVAPDDCEHAIAQTVALEQREEHQDCDRGGRAHRSDQRCGETRRQRQPAGALHHNGLRGGSADLALDFIEHAAHALERPERAPDRL